MSKRGQIFILAAILLAVILFSLATVRNKFEQKTMRGDFEVLADNFQIEASKYINSVVQSKGDVHDKFKDFAVMFTSYAKGKNPEYGLVYVISFGDKIQVANFLNRDITVTGCYNAVGYSVIIPGGFGAIPADLTFEGFTINSPELNWGALEVECTNIPDPNNPPTIQSFCVFLPAEDKTDLTIVIDGTDNYLCAEKGVPELMQVSVMTQGEQAKVRGAGKCMGQDFCNTFTSSAECLECGKDRCCWWPIPFGPLGQPGCDIPNGPTGVCLSNNSYPRRCKPPTDPDYCGATCNKLCYGDMMCFYDSCGVAQMGCTPCKPVGGKTTVCRDETDTTITGTQVTSTNCYKKENSLKCYNDDIYWLSECSTLEGMADDGDCVRYCTTETEPDKCCIPGEQGPVCSDDSKLVCGYSDDCGNEADCNTDCEIEGKVCRDKDDGVVPAQCCIKEDSKKCYNNDLYWFDSCGIKGDLAEDCVNCDVANNKCCVQNFENKCYGDDIYYYDSCGNKGNLAEDCVKYCYANKCCINQGQVCSDDYKYICDYYDDCGNKADCNTDCSANNKVCKCTPSNVCNCVGAHKQFLCRSEYWTGWGDCDEGPPDCAEGYTCVDTDSKSCSWFWEKEKCLCRKEYWTECSEHPSCGSDTYLDQQTCGMGHD